MNGLKSRLDILGRGYVAFVLFILIIAFFLIFTVFQLAHCISHPSSLYDLFINEPAP